MIKILTRDLCIVCSAETGGAVSTAGFNKTPAATAHEEYWQKNWGESTLCLIFYPRFLSFHFYSGQIKFSGNLTANWLEFLHGTEMACELLYRAVVLKLVSENNLRTVTSELVLKLSMNGQWLRCVNLHVLSFPLQVVPLLLSNFFRHCEGKFYIFFSYIFL